ncbi:DNA repair protein RecO [uncultured Pseudoteredinibacter sp.]|uniref:DNA repair protein RecO n=1 Tax=uncultured Pseudoteredinibacter sp. TaxID=1641701 RepID=UPI00261C0141|nr:DNA repair protein RecO [uncultured Pseudoteredinibacter sp.]
MAQLEVVENQEVYVLHSRPFRDSSLLVNLISPEYGRVNVIAKGARKQSGKRQLRQPLQVLTPLLVDWQGRTSLKTLLRWEYRQSALPLQGERLYSALYLNELLLKLLPENDSSSELFKPYESCLQNLLKDQPLQPVLRNFELDLLTCLGYGLDFEHEENGQAISSEGYYCWQKSGLFCQARGPNAYAGTHLLAISQRDFSELPVLRSAKMLMREVIDQLLDYQPLKTREFFRQMQSSKSKSSSAFTLASAASVKEGSHD